MWKGSNRASELGSSSEKRSIKQARKRVVVCVGSVMNSRAEGDAESFEPRRSIMATKKAKSSKKSKALTRGKKLQKTKPLAIYMKYGNVD